MHQKKFKVLQRFILLNFSDTLYNYILTMNFFNSRNSNSSRQPDSQFQARTWLKSKQSVDSEDTILFYNRHAHHLLSRIEFAKEDHMPNLYEEVFRRKRKYRALRPYLTFTNFLTRIKLVLLDTIEYIILFSYICSILKSHHFFTSFIASFVL